MYGSLATTTLVRHLCLRPHLRAILGTAAADVIKRGQISCPRACAVYTSIKTSTDAVELVDHTEEDIESWLAEVERLLGEGDVRAAEHVAAQACAEHPLDARVWLTAADIQVSAIHMSSISSQQFDGSLKAAKDAIERTRRRLDMRRSAIPLQKRQRILDRLWHYDVQCRLLRGQWMWHMSGPSAVAYQNKAFDFLADQSCLLAPHYCDTNGSQFPAQVISTVGGLCLQSGDAETAVKIMAKGLAHLERNGRERAGHQGQGRGRGKARRTSLLTLELFLAEAELEAGMTDRALDRLAQLADEFPMSGPVALVRAAAHLDHPDHVRDIYVQLQRALHNSRGDGGHRQALDAHLHVALTAKVSVAYALAGDTEQAQLYLELAESIAAGKRTHGGPGAQVDYVGEGADDAEVATGVPVVHMRGDWSDLDDVSAKVALCSGVQAVRAAQEWVPVQLAIAQHVLAEALAYPTEGLHGTFVIDEHAASLARNLSTKVQETVDRCGDGRHLLSLGLVPRRYLPRNRVAKEAPQKGNTWGKLFARLASSSWQTEDVNIDVVYE